MNNRRSFLNKLAAGSAVLILPFMTKKVQAQSNKINNVLVHHVYFWLKDPTNKEARKQFEKGVNELVTIENISQSHIGVPASTEDRDVVDHSYTYSLMAIFKSQKDQDIYQKHPTHLKFVEENKDLWEKVVVYDSSNIK